MGKSAKSYKRPTKKEKLGLSANQARASLQKNVQRHAPISEQFKSSSVNRQVASAALLLDQHEAGPSSQPKTAIEQKAQKLLLEAEKRALARQQEADDGMDEDSVTGVSSKKKTGASAMKAKAKKAKDSSNDGTSSKVDYVDLFDGRRPTKNL